MKTLTYSFRIEVAEGDEPNPVHLCEEIQSYLDSNLSYYDDELDERCKVTGYHVESDHMIPFDDTVSVEQCIADGNDYSDCVDHLVQSMEQTNEK